MPGRQPCDQRPVLNGERFVRRGAVEQLFKCGHALFYMPRHAQQARLLQRLAPVAGAEVHFAARGFQGGRVRSQLRQAIELFLCAIGIALAQQIAHPRGDNVRVIRVNQLQPVQRLTHQIFTIARFPQPHLFQQMVLSRRGRGLRQRQKRSPQGQGDKR
nr:Uncharacterised protein [Raoultella sp. NCTC 9187]